MNDADLPHLVIGACLNVHGRLGPGLFREAYEECMAIELRELEMDFRRAVPLDFTYREHEVRNAARLDFIVQDQLLLMIRAQEQVSAQEKQQFESVLRLSGLRGGLPTAMTVGRTGSDREPLGGFWRGLWPGRCCRIWDCQ